MGKHRQIRLLLELKEKFEFVGFFDPNDENAEKVAEEFKIKRFEDMAELIAAVDCLDIVTPTLSHFSCASQAIRASKHVFIEKPITETVDEAKKAD